MAGENSEGGPRFNELNEWEEIIIHLSKHSYLFALDAMNIGADTEDETGHTKRLQKESFCDWNPQ